MANSSFLQAALDLLGRPGNAVRGGVIAGPQGALQGLTGERHFDGTELPGINQLPDEGLSLGPLHVTPRTVAGLTGSTLLDPLTYVGGGLGRLGSLGRVADESGGLLARGAEFRPGLADLPATTVTAKGYLGDAASDPIEKLIEHANSITPGHEIVADSPAAAERAVADQTGSEAGARRLSIREGSLEDLDPRTGDPLHAQVPPDTEPTPIGDQRYAQAKDRLGRKASGSFERGLLDEKGQPYDRTGIDEDNRGPAGYRRVDTPGLGLLNTQAIPARQWLTETSKATIDRSPQTWEDVVGVDRGSNPDDVVPRTVNPRTGETLYHEGPQDSARTLRDSAPDLQQGPGLTSQYNGETVGFSRQEVMNHLSALEQQIQELSRTLTGDKGSRFGDPLERRGMENTLSDWQARRQMAADPSLLDAETGNAVRSDAAWRARNGKAPNRDGTLSAKQQAMVQNKTGQQLSREESFRRAPDSRYYNREQGQMLGDDGQMYARRANGPADEANLNLAERESTRAPHGDPLEEERALRAEQDKFGRKGAGTYRASEDLGHMDNERGPGAGGVRGHYESGDVGTGTGMDAQGRFQPGLAPVHVVGTRVSEPLAGGTPQQLSAVTHANPQFDEQAIQAEIEMAQLRHAIQRTLLNRLGANRFLGR